MPERPSPMRRTLLGRPTPAQLVIGILLALVGFAAVVQVRAQNQADSYPGARRGDLVQLLDSLDAASQRAQNQIAELAATKQELQNSGTKYATALGQARAEAETLAILSGTVAATGPGVSVRIDDPAGAVSAATLLNALEELRDAGAEAIEINDTVRVVAQTYVADANAGISVDGATVQPPYVLDVIGSPTTLGVAVRFPGGLADQVSALGGEVIVHQTDAVDVTSLADQSSPQYASPTP